jgi:hypothetical protein
MMIDNLPHESNNKLHRPSIIFAAFCVIRVCLQASNPINSAEVREILCGKVETSSTHMVETTKPIRSAPNRLSRGLTDSILMLVIDFGRKYRYCEDGRDAGQRVNHLG